MDLGLKGKTALVLGAGSGLGRAIALSLGGEGAQVAIAGRRMQTVQESIRLTQAAGSNKTLGLEWDLADLSQIDPQITRIEKELGPIDILVNNTGGPPPTPASGQDPATWTKFFQSMVLSVIAITDRALPNMKARRWGRIITNTSGGIITPIP